jgi:hypothetical protein
MRSVLLLLLAAIILVSCNGYEAGAVPISDVSSVLTECSEGAVSRAQEWFDDIAQAGGPRLSIWHADGSERRAKVMLTATSWALDNCFLPCEGDMCGLVSTPEDGFISVYIRPSFDFPVDYIVPEAEITLDAETLIIRESHILHSGCATPCKANGA